MRSGFDNGKRPVRVEVDPVEVIRLAEDPPFGVVSSNRFVPLLDGTGLVEPKVPPSVAPYLLTATWRRRCGENVRGPTAIRNMGAA